MRLALSSRDALPMGALPAYSLMWNEWRGETSLLGGELALPVWVARVSRFIGKSDTTAK